MEQGQAKCSSNTIDKRQNDSNLPTDHAFITSLA